MNNRGVSYGLMLTVGLLTGACSDGAGSNDSIEAAFAHVAKGRDEAEAKVKAAEKMASLKRQAEDEAAKAKEEAFTKLIEVPAQGPADLDAACASVVEAFDAFHGARLDETEKQRYEATKQPDLDKLAKACQGHGNTRAAACQSNALTNADGQFVADDAAFILSKCEEKAGVEGTKTAAI